MYSKAGVSLSYTPWLRKLVNDVALANLSGYYKIGDSDLQAVGASLRYFSLGDVPYNPITGESTGNYSVSPYEMAFDVSYSRKLSESFFDGCGHALYPFGYGEPTRLMKAACPVMPLLRILRVIWRNM